MSEGATREEEFVRLVALAMVGDEAATDDLLAAVFAEIAEGPRHRHHRWIRMFPSWAGASKEIDLRRDIATLVLAKLKEHNLRRVRDWYARIDDRSSFLGWLMQIAFRTARDYSRSKDCPEQIGTKDTLKWVRVIPTEPNKLPERSSGDQSSELIDRIAAATEFSRAPKREQQAISAYRMVTHGFTWHEIATKLDAPGGAEAFRKQVDRWIAGRKKR